MKRRFVFLAYLAFLLMLLTACETESKTEGKDNKVKELKYEGSTLEIKDEYNEWNLSPKFNYQTKSYSGESSTYEVIGSKDGFGITGNFPMKADKQKKFFWFYWGEENIKNQPVKVMAYKKGSEELIKVFSGKFYEGAQINENEVNMPSYLMLPSPGVWNLLAYINDELSGNIVVEVIPKG
ncbi:hypothetical protein [Halobacillus naozhouensis]|uniref:DUF4871 domain-containing protein n=1 Tax=Halobacillus naozhouensis TaxID=554880 RepID=A0ABY8J325_9BACI|nr:hypothetical protein [Halobacillus naozhouensis]WFT76477.1 hypothetical protein P9989_08985 [Halobacillus naozhouensis]